MWPADGMPHEEWKQIAANSSLWKAIQGNTVRHGVKRWQPASEQLIPGPLRRARAAVASQVHAAARDGSSAAALDTAAASDGAVALGADHIARQSNASVSGHVASVGPSVSDMLLMRAEDIGAAALLVQK